MTIYYYRVAGFLFPVRLPADMDAEKLLPSFRQFRTSGCAGDEELLFDFAVVEPDDMPEPEIRQLLEETDNDMGHLSLYATVGGYMVEVANNSHTHRITANADFSCVFSFHTQTLSYLRKVNSMSKQVCSSLSSVSSHSGS